MTSYPSPSAALVRPAQLSDAAHLQQMCWPGRSLDSITELLVRAEKLDQNRRGQGVVAVYNHAACAFGMLTLWPRTAEISDLIVTPSYRGQGIGSQIITYLTEAACRLQVQILEIGVALSNPRALALYRRLGFTDHHTVNLDLGCGLETVLYLYKMLENGRPNGYRLHTALALPGFPGPGSRTDRSAFRAKLRSWHAGRAAVRAAQYRSRAAAARNACIGCAAR